MAEEQVDGIKVVISATDDDFAKKMRDANTAMEKLRVVAATVGAALQNLRARFENVTSKIRVATAAVLGFAGSLLKVIAGTILKGILAIGAAVLGIVGAATRASKSITNLVRSVSGSVADMKALAEGLGLTINQLQVLKVAAVDANTPFSMLTRILRLLSGAVGRSQQETQAAIDTFGKLGVTVDAAAAANNDFGLALDQVARLVSEASLGSEDAAKKIESLGISVRDTSGELRTGEAVMKDVEAVLGKVTRGGNALSKAMKDIGSTATNPLDALKDIAGYLETLKSDTEKLSWLTKAFGAQMGTKLFPIVKEGKKAFEEWTKQSEKLGLTLTDKVVAKFSDADRAFGYFNLAIQGLRTQLAASFAEPVTKMIESFTKTLTENRDTLIGWANTVGDWLLAVVQDVLNVVNGAADKPVTWVGRIAAALGSLFGAVTEETPPIVKALKNLWSAIASLASQGGEKIADAITASIQNMTNWLTKSENDPGKVIAGWIDNLTSAIQRIPAALDELIAKINEVMPTVMRFAETMGNIGAGINGFFGGNPDGSETGFLDRLKNILVQSWGNIVGFREETQPPKYASGGLIRGRGTGTSDSILAKLSNGEFVVNAAATSLFRPLLEQMNAVNRIPAFANGGYAGRPINLNLPNGQSYALKASEDTARMLERALRADAISGTRKPRFMR